MLLKLLQRNPGITMSPAELARATDIPRPTVYRLLEILENEGYVRRLADGSFYAAPPIDGSLAGEWAAFVTQMRPVLERVAANTGNAVFLSRRDGDDLVCMHREIGTHPVQVLSLQVGGRSPLGVGAGGIAMLSTLPDAQIESIMARNAAAYIEYGNLQVSTLRKLTANCRERGYAVVGNYALKGVLAIGVPIMPTARRPLSSISVTAPHERMPLARQKVIAEMIRGEIKAHR